MSKRALASTPWVGSSISSTFGVVQESCATTPLFADCRRTGRRSADRARPRRCSSFSTSESAAAPLLRRRDQAAGGELRRAPAPSCSRARPALGKIDSAARSALSERMPASSASRGVPSLIGRTGAKHLAACFLEAAERAHRLALPVAFGACKSEDFAAANSKADLVKSRAAQISWPRARSRSSADAGLTGYSVSIGRPTIKRDQIVFRQPARSPRRCPGRRRREGW